MRDKEPFTECKTCKTLGDCPSPDIEENMMGSPMPSDRCLRPIEIMANTLKAKKMMFNEYLKKEEV